MLVSTPNIMWDYGVDVTVVSTTYPSSSDDQDMYNVSVVPTDMDQVPRGLPPWFRVVVYILFSCLTVLGVLGLTALIVASYKMKHSWTPTHSVILSAALSQLCMDITVLVSLPNLLDICKFKTQSGIKIYIAVMFTNAGNALLHTTIFSTDTCMKIRWPFFYTRVARSWKTNSLLALTWIVSLLMGCSMLLWVNFPPDLDDIDCLVYSGTFIENKESIIIYTNVAAISLVVVNVVEEIIVIMTARKQAMQIRDQTRSVERALERPRANTEESTEDVEQPHAASRMRRRIQEHVGPLTLRTIVSFVFGLWSMIICWSVLISMFDLFVLRGSDYIYHVVLTFIITFNVSGFGLIICTNKMSDYKVVFEKTRAGFIIAMNSYWLFFTMRQKK